MSREQLPLDTIVIFDGLCNLCSHSVQFILEYETAPRLSFASVQSATGARLLIERGLDPQDVSTFVLIEGDASYERSQAAIRLASYLRMPWRILGGLRVFPQAWLDWGYNLIARNRYRWFGRREVCMLPSVADAQRFLD